MKSYLALLHGKKSHLLVEKIFFVKLLSFFDYFLPREHLFSLYVGFYAFTAKFKSKVKHKISIRNIIETSTDPTR